MLKLLFIFLGSLFLGLGFVGILVPGLPATPFLLLSAGCYVRSSNRLYNWLLNHKIFGKYIKTFREHRALSKSSKIISLVSMWIMICISAFFFIQNIFVRIILFIAGFIGTFVILKIKTYQDQDDR